MTLSVMRQFPSSGFGPRSNVRIARGSCRA